MICFHRICECTSHAWTILICSALPTVIPSMLQYLFKYYPFYISSSLFFLILHMFSSSFPQLSVFFSSSSFCFNAPLCHLTYNGIILDICTLLTLAPTSSRCFMLTLIGCFSQWLGQMCGKYVYYICRWHEAGRGANAVVFEKASEAGKMYQL